MQSFSTASIYRLECPKERISEPTSRVGWDYATYGPKEAFYAWLRLKPSAYSGRPDSEGIGCVVFEYGGGAIPLTRNENSLAHRVGIEHFMHKAWLEYWVNYYLEKWREKNA